MAHADAIAAGAASTHSIDPPIDEIEEIRPADERENHWLIRTLSVIGFLGAWELGARWLNDPLMLCTPSDIVVAFGQMISNGELPKSLYESAITLIFGFLLATVVGVLLGLFIGRYRKVEAATDWLVNGLYATPLVALIPLV
ncbi:MAG: ABC transporter permease, partial [Sphingomonas sp.]